MGNCGHEAVHPGRHAVKIVFFVQDTPAVYGAERATLDLALGLREAGEQVEFFLIEELRNPAGAGSGLAAAVASVGFACTRFPAGGRFSPALASAVKAAFVARGADLLHLVGYKANVHAWWGGIRPRVATVHGWLFRREFKERFYGWLDVLALQRCDGVICLSRYYRALLEERGLRPAALALIPSGLRQAPALSDALVDRPSGRPFTFGMMGRFSEEKNHRAFLRAAALLHARFPEVQFRLAGGGPLEKALRAEARTAGLEAVLEFSGYQDVDAFMPQLDVYVICSWIENLPYSILEAMGWARPVIGSRVGGIPDLVEDGRTGWLFDPRDEGALLRAMENALADPDRARRLGRAGREKLDAGFRPAVCIERHRALSRDLVEQRHG